MEFHCRLGTETGDVIEDVRVAESEAALRRELEAGGLYVLALSRRGVGWSGFSRTPRRRIRTREFIVFNQELAALLKAGLPLVQSLDILRQRTDDPAFKGILDDVHDRVRAGAALSEAFDAQGRVVPAVYTASLSAGEKSGGLEEVVRRYVDHVKVVTALRRKTLSALIYPAILLGLSLVVVSVIILRVVPEFEAFYAGFGAELPLLTRTTVAVSNAARANLLLFAAGAGLAAWAGRRWLRRPGGAALLDRVVLRLPGVGPIAGRFAASQMSRTLATLLGGGIPLVDAIRVASRALGNRFYGEQLEAAGQRVREGEPLAAALAARGVFPSVVIRMVEVGEATGALREMLTSVADFFDEELDTRLGRFVAVIEPVLLIVMGLVIAALLVALYLPLIQLGSVLS